MNNIPKNKIYAFTLKINYIIGFFFFFFTLLEFISLERFKIFKIDWI